MKEAFRRLSMEERDAVAELLGDVGWRPLLKLIVGLVTDEEDKLIAMSVADGVDKVIHQKLRAEGARKLARDVEQLPNYIRKLVKEEG